MIYSDDEIRNLMSLVSSANEQLKTLADVNREFMTDVNHDDNYTLFIEETAFGMQLDDMMNKLVKTFDQGAVPQANAVFGQTMQYLDNQLRINRDMRLKEAQRKKEEQEALDKIEDHMV